MNIKHILTGILAVTAGALTSCQPEADEKGYGYLQLSSVEVNKTVDTRADITAQEAIAVDITNESGTLIEHADDWNELKTTNVPLRVGIYTVKAYSFGKQADAQGFDAEPYYAGQEEVVLEANKAKTVSIVCKLAQSMVSVSTTDNFKTAFPGYTCALRGNAALDIPFAANETRAAYVKAGQPLTISLDLGNGNTFKQQIVAEALPAYHYNITLDITEGNSEFDISVDETIHQYDVTFKVPTKQESKDMVTTDISLDISKVWGQFAYLEGQCNIEGNTNPVQFRYKKKADTQWTTVDAIQEGAPNNYTARIAPLDFGTEYEYYIVCGDKTGETLSFFTESFEQIPNLNFDTWSQDGKNWYPNADKANSYWATGNEGATIMSSSNTTGVNDAVAGTAARMETIEVDAIFTKVIAAGNLFIGSYETNMENPASSVTFGKPYSGARPVKLTGHYKYQPSTNMNGGSIPSDRTLTIDECEIYIKLWNAEEVIGEGHFVSNQTVSDYTPFEIDIEYADPTKRPDKITIVATSSRYGGEFSGMKVIGQVAVGSILWVDEFELKFY